MTVRLSAVLLLAVTPLLAQQPPPPAAEPPHGIEMVDSAPLGGAIAPPLPEAQKRKLKKYDIPELAGAHQALGSQLIGGALPRPIIDFVSTAAKVQERISFFDGGLVVIDVSGGGATIRKRVLLPTDAFRNYTGAITAARLAAVRADALVPPRDGRRATLRVYDAPGHFVEREYDPMSTQPKRLADQVIPMQDLLRAFHPRPPPHRGRALPPPSPGRGGLGAGGGRARARLGAGGGARPPRRRRDRESGEGVEPPGRGRERRGHRGNAAPQGGIRPRLR